MPSLPSRSRAKTSATSLAWSRSTCAYTLSVMAGSACPRLAATTCTGTPALKQGRVHVTQVVQPHNRERLVWMLGVVLSQELRHQGGWRVREQRSADLYPRTRDHRRPTNPPPQLVVQRLLLMSPEDLDRVGVQTHEPLAAPFVVPSTRLPSTIPTEPRIRMPGVTSKVTSDQRRLGSSPGRAPVCAASRK
jgi:hypothetical protein